MAMAISFIAGYKTMGLYILWWGYKYLLTGISGGNCKGQVKPQSVWLQRI